MVYSWSYGVLLWEIMTFGEQPYPQIFSSEHLFDYLQSGQRMEKPQRCPINMYVLITNGVHTAYHLPLLNDAYANLHFSFLFFSHCLDMR